MRRQITSRPKLSAKVAATTFNVVVLMSGSAQALEPGSRTALKSVKSWGYQLQNLDVRQAARMRHDLLVVDYSKNGTEAGALTWSELSQLKYKPDGTRRIVLSYLSIGEAENYRYYWKPLWQKTPPRWLGRENKQWPGNFLAKYWMPEWQEIILREKTGYLSKIISSGFDGVYLDRIDAYADWSPPAKEPRKRMIDFVAKLSRIAKSKNNDFIIFTQNAEELLTDSRYIAHIDGVAKEDMLFGAAHRSKSNSKSLRASHIKYLKIAQSNNIPVLVVEYLPSQSHKAIKVVKRIRKLKFVPYISTRKLDQLIPPPQ